MIFEFPQAFLLMLVTALVLLLLRRAGRFNRANAAAYGVQGPKQAYYHLKIALIGVFVLSLTFIAARPSMQYEMGGGFLFVTDISRSMDARYSCSEATFLDRAKDVMRNTLQAIPEGRFGIFAFDRFAFPITQLTGDASYLQEVIEHGLYVGLMMEATQTDIANALSVVALKKEQLPESYTQISHVVLLSDGHVTGDYRRRLKEPLRNLRKAGMVVSAVGIGNPQETPIIASTGAPCNSVHIEVDGDKVLIPLRADVLKFIATEGGGAYFTEAETSELVDVLRSELRPVVAADGKHDDGPRRDISWLFLVLATVSLCLLFYLPVRFFRP